MNTDTLFPPQASTFSGSLDALLGGAISVALLIVVLVVSVICTMWLYRRMTNSSWPAFSTLRSIRAAAVLAALTGVLTLFFWGKVIRQNLQTVPIHAITLDVALDPGQWQVSRADGPEEMNEVHVPVGQPIHLRIHSRIPTHYFSIPALRVGQELTVDQTTSLWFQAVAPGTYPIFGVAPAKVLAMMPADYAKWMARLKRPVPTPVAALPSPKVLTLSAKPASPAVVQAKEKPVDPALIKEGISLFKSMGCVGCHRPGAVGGGPVLKGVYGATVQIQDLGPVVADDAYLRESILNPRAKIVEGHEATMPAFEGRISDQELRALLAYIRSLATPGGNHP